MSIYVECPVCGCEQDIDEDEFVKELHQKITTESRPVKDVLDELFRDHGLLWRGEGLEGSNS